MAHASWPAKCYACDTRNPFGLDIETWIGREGVDCDPQSPIYLIDDYVHARHYIKVVNRSTVALRVMVSGSIGGKHARFDGRYDIPRNDPLSWEESANVEGVSTVDTHCFVGARILRLDSGADVIRTKVRIQSQWDPDDAIRIDRPDVPLDLEIELFSYFPVKK